MTGLPQDAGGPKPGDRRRPTEIVGLYAISFTLFFLALFFFLDLFVSAVFLWEMTLDVQVSQPVWLGEMDPYPSVLFLNINK
jgi:hypothetical protein